MKLWESINPWAKAEFYRQEYLTLKLSLDIEREDKAKAHSRHKEVREENIRLNNEIRRLEACGLESAHLKSIIDKLTIGEKNVE